jgi:hypothetical protein
LNFSGNHLSTSFNKAAIMKQKHRLLVDRYTESFTPEEITKWNGVMRAWHADHSKPDPFAEVEEGERVRTF